MSEDSSGSYRVVVHGQERGQYSDESSAFAAAGELKRQNPNKHVAVRNPKGISTPVD
jgi:hypothetical protein